MKNIFLLSLSLMFCLYSTISYGQSKKFERKKLLIYTKNGEGYVHKNIPASVATLQKICESIGVESIVSEDPALFTSSEINSFDAAFCLYKQRSF
jgi:hypothetical protein